MGGRWMNGGGGGEEGTNTENGCAIKWGGKLYCKIGKTTKLNAEIYYNVKERQRRTVRDKKLCSTREKKQTNVCIKKQQQQHQHHLKRCRSRWCVRLACNWNAAGTGKTRWMWIEGELRLGAKENNEKWSKMNERTMENNDAMQQLSRVKLILKAEVLLNERQR